MQFLKGSFRTAKAMVTMMHTMTLNGTWTLRGKPQGRDAGPITLPAAVPCEAALALSEAGYLPRDLFMGMNILETGQYEDWEWWYETTFSVPTPENNTWLIFRGVDCEAEYFLNGQKLGESRNAFTAHEFRIDGILRAGENTLTVHLTSAVVAAHGESYDLFSLAVAGRQYPTDVALRRPAHSNGWDIFPRAVTCGIWRDVLLEVRDTIRFTQAFFDFSHPSGPRFCFETESAWADFRDVEIEISASCGDSVISVRRPIRAKAGWIGFRVEQPKLWWPFGYGEQNLYDAVLRIYACGQPVHEKKTRFGIRSVELQRTDVTDGVNGCFRFLVNGVEIMCRGANWVPLDVFHSRDASRYEQALALAKDLGCTILRCWGGGVYEDHAFYDFCDENGILIWQDFMMACYTYPQTERYFAQLREEAAAVIRELRHHPCILLWSDNECDYPYRAARDARPSMNRITRELLGEAVRLNDVGRPYLPSSPYIDDRTLTDRALTPPEDHLWGPRDYYKSDFYKQSRAHFVSETGYHGCPSMESVRKFITPDHVWPYYPNSEWNLHSTDQNDQPWRVLLMEKQVRQIFGTVPTDPDDYALASQISQAEAKKYFIERIRVDRPRRSGIIWWNLLDGWPQMSDAVVGYHFDRKLAYHYIKRAQAPFTVAANELADWRLPIVACNDTQDTLHGQLRVHDADTGETLFEGSFTAQPNTSTVLVRLEIFYSERRLLLFDWTLSDHDNPAVSPTGRNHYLCGYPPYDFNLYKSWISRGLLGTPD